MSKKQKPDLDILNMNLCTCATLRKAARTVTQVFDSALQETGLKAGQLSLLATLANQGEMPVTVLAEVLVVDRTTLTRNLKPLVRDGLVKTLEEEDQRVRMVGLTNAGMKRFEEAYPLWVEVQSKLVDSIGPERWAGFIADLNRTVEVTRIT